MATLIRLTVEGPAGPLNNAIASFVWGDDVGDNSQYAITCAAYLTKAMQLQGVDSLITSAVAHDLDGAVVGPGVSATFDPDLWADWVAIDGDLPAATAWGFATGGLGTSLAAAGVSITMMEHVAAGGRHNGRHYLPWTCKDAITATGIVGSTVRTNLSENYEWKMRGSIFTRPTWCAGMVTAVRMSSGTLNEIFGAQASANPARLRSRVR